MATAMTPDEALAYLVERPRTANLATTRRDGSPHVAPVWIALDDDGTVVFTTGAATAKGRSLRRDGRVALCVDDDRPPFSFVVVEGTVEISEDPADLLRWATQIAARYMGEER